MLSENPSLAEVVGHGLDAALAGVFKAMPGIVRSYDSVTNLATVQPAIKRASYSVSDGKRSFTELPEIPCVPVVFPRAGGFVLRTPVNEGDTVLLVFCDSSLAEFRTNGGVSEPQDARRHSIGWPVAIVGCFPDSKPLSPIDAASVTSGQAVFGEDGGKQVRVGESGIELATAGVTPVSPVALSIPTDAALTTIVGAVNVLIGAVNAFATEFNAHTHEVATAPLPPPVPLPDPPPPPGFSGVTAPTASQVPAAPAGPAAPATTASLLVRSL